MIIRRILSAVVDAVVWYLKQENSNTTGKINLVSGILLIVFAVIGTVPAMAESSIRIIMNRPSPEWTSVIPLVALIALILYFAFCLRLIPPNPPHG